MANFFQVVVFFVEKSADMPKFRPLS